MSEKTRVIIPDIHGNHGDGPATTACLLDVKRLAPSEIVLLGDLLDCGGVFSTHQRTYTNELVESYSADVEAANSFLDALQAVAPSAKIHYLEGNHEQHVERWAARTFLNKEDADTLLDAYGPWAALRLKSRGIRYYRRSVMYQGLSIPGAIRLGQCFFVHGVSHAKHAASEHLRAFGASVVYGHTHRSQAVVERTVTSSGHGAWCPGCLCKLQPLYKHTVPTTWAHGYGLQFVAASGRFMHINVPIVRGGSLLPKYLG
jgi:UDP-2,3-diacylglucosamine pyrophosphatase LpxH